jgi:hypothetical protein
LIDLIEYGRYLSTLWLIRQKSTSKPGENREVVAGAHGGEGPLGLLGRRHRHADRSGISGRMAAAAATISVVIPPTSGTISAFGISAVR